MSATSRATCACIALASGLLAGAAARAQEATDALTPRGGEPRVQHIVSEDEAVRIEELRVRGQTQRIVVRSKLTGVRPYEIVPASAARDLSQDRRNAGQRVWSVLSF